MAIVLDILLPDGYSPRDAVKIHWVWPSDKPGEVEDITSIMVEIHHFAGCYQAIWL